MVSEFLKIYVETHRVTPIRSRRETASAKVLNGKFSHSAGMKAQRFLVVERKPTISGDQARVPVGGEILPVNSLQLFLANFWWILLLAIPVLMYFLTARYGIRTPRHFRQALRLVPVVARSLG